MSTLILGHEFDYRMEYIRCSPIDTKLWYFKPFICVSYHCNKDGTNIVYDLINSKDYRFTKETEWTKIYKQFIKYDGHWVWKFAENNSYDMIVDCMGSISWDRTTGSPDTYKYKFQDELLTTILRILKQGGKFYSAFGIYTKLNDFQLDFEKKERSEYQYIN